jgi:aspartyl-tRNA(Asn)/glutamyl-tRNA(Gln) amidotransferase subunit A
MRNVKAKAAAPALEFTTIEELAPLLAKKKLSPVELAQLYLARIERLNPKLNAFITVTAERALADARSAERELHRGRRRGPLHGIPIVLKDNIWTRGIRTTVGSSILRDFVPEEDATVARRLRQAGAVLLGKTHLHEFAYGATSDNPHFGPARNPWATDRIPGGSSGGSAIAVAAGMCVAALGSDTGGSIRIPAALCGVVGLKPTFGRVSVHGVFPLAPSFDHVGPIARSTADAALLLGAIAGRDPLDETTVARPQDDFRRRATHTKIRLGRPREHFWTHLDPEVRRLLEAAVSALAKHAGAVKDVSLPAISAGVEAANTIAAVQATRVHQQAGYFPARAADYGKDVRSRLEQGGQIRAVDYVEAQELMRRARAEFQAVFAHVDAVVVPTVSIAAPPIGADPVRVGDVEKPLRNVLIDLNRPGNFTGLPAITVPCGFTPEGLPVGLQLIGRAFDEATLLRVAGVYERENQWRSAHPPLA